MTSTLKTAAAAAAAGGSRKAVREESVPNMSMQNILDGDNERGIPTAKFIDDVGAFSQSFTPPASAELLIGAYSDLITQYRNFETQLNHKREC